MSRFAVIALALLALLAGAAPASADEAFLGVLSDGRAARFTNTALPAVTPPQRVSGLARGDRIVSLSANHALGSSGRIYRFAAGTRRATATGVDLALSGRNFSLVVDPGQNRARVVSDRGQDLVADLASGTVTAGPGLRTTSGAQITPVLALLPDGRLVGVDAIRNALVTEKERGSSVFAELPLRNRREQELQLAHPLQFAIAAGRGYLLSGFPRPGRTPQSRLIQVDLATGQTTGEAGPFFFRELVALMALATVAPDRTAPRASFVDPPSRVSLRTVSRTGGLRLRVRCSEACSVFAATAIGGRRNAVSFATRDTAGVITVVPPGVRGRALRLMRLRLNKDIFLRATVQDMTNNAREISHRVRLVP